MYLGIDLGTQSVKVILVDTAGKVVRTAQEAYPIHRPFPDWAEQNPSEWWDAAVNAVQEACRHYSDAVQGIGITGQMHGVVLLDAARKVLRPAIIWMDQRSRAEAASRPVAEWLKMAHNPLTPGIGLASLMWLEAHEPHICEQVSAVLMPKDWLRFQLTHTLVTDMSDASGAFLLDLPAQTWSSALMDVCDLTFAQLPHLLTSTALAGELTKSAAKALGLPPRIPVSVGAADQAAMLVGSGVLFPGQAALTIGTGGQMSVVTDAPRPDHHLNTFCHAVSDMYYSMGAILAGGYALSWWQGILGIPMKKILSSAVAIPAGSEGLLYHPYLNGERTPHMNPDLSAAFHGLTGRHTQGHMTRAVMEGVAFAMRDCLEALQKVGANPQHMVMGGGGAKGDLWRKIFASVLDMPLTTLKQPEPTALGAAMLAAVGTGQFSGLAEAAAAWVKPGNTVQPEPEWVEVYAEQYQRYREISVT